MPMTGISAVPPAPSVLPTSEPRMRATSDGADFQSLLQAQSRPPLQQSDKARTRMLFDNLAACTFNGEKRAICSDVIGTGGLNAFAIAVALSPLTVTWVPTEIVRAPLRSPGIRTFRRRNPSSAESSFLNRSSSEDRGYD